LPEFGRHRGVVSQKNKRSSPESGDPGGFSERTRDSVEEQWLQVRQAAGLAGECLQLPGSGQQFADLVCAHEDVWRETV
jgi:hypothetical protein